MTATTHPAFCCPARKARTEQPPLHQAIFILMHSPRPEVPARYRRTNGGSCTTAVLVEKCALAFVKSRGRRCSKQRGETTTGAAEGGRKANAHALQISVATADSRNPAHSLKVCSENSRSLPFVYERAEKSTSGRVTTGPIGSPDFRVI